MSKNLCTYSSVLTRSDDTWGTPWNSRNSIPYSPACLACRTQHSSMPPPMSYLNRQALFPMSPVGTPKPAVAPVTCRSNQAGRLRLGANPRTASRDLIGHLVITRLPGCCCQELHRLARLFGLLSGCLAFCQAVWPSVIAFCLACSGVREWWGLLGWPASLGCLGWLG